MYKKLIITLVALLCCAVTFAQEQEDRWIWPDEHIKDAFFLHVGLGPKVGGGLAMATVPMFYDFELKGRFAYQLGVALNANLSQHPSLGLSGIGRLGLEIEALYGSQRFKSGDETVVMNCIEIPVMLQFYITREFQVEAGLTPTKMLKVSPEYLQAGNVVANLGGIQGGDVKISAGLAYKTAMGLAVGLRYNYGLSELAENFHSKTSTAMVSISYLFPLVK